MAERSNAEPAILAYRWNTTSTAARRERPWAQGLVDDFIEEGHSLPVPFERRHLSLICKNNKDIESRLLSLAR